MEKKTTAMHDYHISSDYHKSNSFPLAIAVMCGCGTLVPATCRDGLFQDKTRRQELRTVLARLSVDHHGVALLLIDVSSGADPLGRDVRERSGPQCEGRARAPVQPDKEIRAGAVVEPAVGGAGRGVGGRVRL